MTRIAITVAAISFATLSNLAIVSIADAACNECASASSCQCSTCQSGPTCCDCKKKKEIAAKIAAAHKPVFYDNDFSYVLDPCFDDWWLGDHFKRRSLGDNVTYDIGGQGRYRYHHEHNIRGLGLTGIDDNFLLRRHRLFLNMEVGENWRFYGEAIDAQSSFETFPPRLIEENRADVLNLFIDGVLWTDGDGRLTGRVGRQELLYGSQRLVSPLDWADTRRTFDGAKLMWSGKNWNVDGFWTRPVRPEYKEGDNWIDEEQFYGTFATYKGFEKDTAETYWLAYDSTITGFRYDTLGTRYVGSNADWLYELEGGVQFGENSDDTSHSSGFFTVGLGRKINAPWSPTLWAYYDWASGSDDTAQRHGFNHLFPLAHKYLGFMDLFGRSNIETPNVLLTMKPTEKLTVLCWYYYFFLENKNDTPYSVVMTPFAPNVTPQSADLGQEIDLLFSYAVCPRMEFQVGYSHFFAGDYYATPGVPFDGDADFAYVQYQFNY